MSFVALGVRLALTSGLLAEASSPGFLVISAPRSALISWVKLPEGSSFNGSMPKTLIDSGLNHPQGIAVDQKRKRLYVADPDVRKIYMYQLAMHGDDLKVVGNRRIVCRDSESRWVAVDGIGNVFFTDEPRSRILKIPEARVLREDQSPEVVIDHTAFTQVSSPGGVAVDNVHVYWTNKNSGTRVGSIARGPEMPLPKANFMANRVSVLAHNIVKSYGVCLAMDNVYFTDSRQSLFGVKKSGGMVTQVSSKLKNPRGCAWDGDGTVYVADRGANAVYSFAGGMRHIEGARLKKAFDIEDAFGLAVATDSWSAAALSRPNIFLGLLALAYSGMR